MAAEDFSTKGWNWGKFEFEPTSIDFRVQEQVAFRIPYNEISQSLLQGRNQVSVEIQQSDASAADDDCLTEIRIHVPSETNEEDGVEVETDQVPAPEKFTKEIIQRAKIVGVNTADSIVAFKNLLFLTPRGRFDIEVHPNFIKLHGASASYNILYKNISHLFLLQKPDGHTVFVLNLDPPIRQGQTPHNFLLVQFKRDEEAKLELNLTEEQIVKYQGLQKNMEGPLSDLVARVIKFVSGKRVSVPGNFRNSAGTTEIRCSLRNDSGFLFPLEKSFVYIPKPTTYIRHEDISLITFDRLSSKDSSKTFDLVIQLKTDETLTFAGINRNEFEKLSEFINSKKLKVENSEDLQKAKSLGLRAPKQEDDEDPYLAQLREESEDGDDDDDDEDDSDFEGGDSSDSDSEEYESKSEASDSESGASDEEKKSKKRKKETRRDKSAKKAKKSKDKEQRKKDKKEKKLKKKEKKDQKRREKEAAAAASSSSASDEVKPEVEDDSSAAVKEEPIVEMQD